MSQSDDEIVLLPLTLGKGGMMSPLLMPDVMSRLIHDFVRPDLIKVAAKKNMDDVIARVKSEGEQNIYCGQDSMAWGLWVNTLNDDEWQRLIVEHAMTPEVEARMRAADWSDAYADEFLELSFTQTWLLDGVGSWE